MKLVEQIPCKKWYNSPNRLSVHRVQIQFGILFILKHLTLVSSSQLNISMQGHQIESDKYSLEKKLQYLSIMKRYAITFNCRTLQQLLFMHV
jgi:hypothetical protein